MDEERNSENEALISYVKETHGVELLSELDEKSVVVLPEGMQTQHLGQELAKFTDQRAPAPRRRSGTVSLQDEASFLLWVNRVLDLKASCIYANDESLVAVINDHASAEQEHAPGWGDFRGVYELTKSSELQEWMLASRWMDQKGFAKLLEDRILDVLPVKDAGEQAIAIAEALAVPIAGPMELMVLSRGLSLRVNAKVTEMVNLSSGESEFAYAEEHTNTKGKPLKIPGAFVVGLPIFERGESYKMPVRLRYQLNDGKVSWKVELLRLQESVDAALNEMVARVAEGTGLPVFRGTAPAKTR